MSQLLLSVTTKLREIKHSFTRYSGAKVEVFNTIHDSNSWQSPTSVSGPGSELGETEEIRALLPSLFSKLDIKSFLDAPCGDFHWMSHVDLTDINYIGGDVVPQLIERNYKQFGDATKHFMVLDIIKDSIPKVDLILCRDCLIHLSLKDGRRALANMKRSGSRYLLITTNPSIRVNYPINTGECRGVNLELPPYSMGKPIEQHRDRREPAPGEMLIDQSKSIALYRLNKA